MKLSDEFEKTLARARSEAMARDHEFITLEHLLYALTIDASAEKTLHRCGADLDRLRAELRMFFENELAGMKLPYSPVEPRYTMGVQFVLQLAAAHVHSAEKGELEGSDVLAALFRENESHAVYFLKQQGITRLEVLRSLSHGRRTHGRGKTAPIIPALSSEDVDGVPEKAREADPLQAYCTNLNENARAGKYDPLIGRADELSRTVHILSRRRKNNPVFVGEAGVGKTAIAEGLASRVVAGDIPESLRDITIYSLDVAALLSGTRYRGDFEERMKAVVDALRSRPESVLLIDEIHVIIGAGAVSGGAMDASNILKPALVSGDIRCIGTTTYDEFRRIFEKDRALSRRFQKVDVAEPSVETALAILEGLKPRYEEYHGVTYEPEAIVAAVELSVRHIADRRLPDKAIDVMDEAGAEAKLSAGKKAVGVRDIESLVSRIANVPARTVRSDDREKLRTLAQDLKAVIFGQDGAVDQVTSSIQLSRAGLGQPEAPVGSFLFAGPTGVGKTELARQVAAALGITFHRFDMSEYMEKHTVSRLIGSPPGYVGFEQGGQLTDAVYKTPHCVLLLDEIEKAHEEVFNILLQVMDHGILTDNNGRQSVFRDVVLIMTTNVGARESQSRPIGFDQPSYLDRSMKAIEKAFSPEFRNRLTAIVGFVPLAMPIVELVVEKMIFELQTRLAGRKITLQLDGSARIQLAREGFDPQFGARPIRRLIENNISTVLTREILFGKLADGGKVSITASAGKLQFKVTGKKRPKGRIRKKSGALTKESR